MGTGVLLLLDVVLVGKEGMFSESKQRDLVVYLYRIPKCFFATYAIYSPVAPRHYSLSRYHAPSQTRLIPYLPA